MLHVVEKYKQLIARKHNTMKFGNVRAIGAAHECKFPEHVVRDALSLRIHALSSSRACIVARSFFAPSFGAFAFSPKFCTGADEACPICRLHAPGSTILVYCIPNTRTLRSLRSPREGRLPLRLALGDKREHVENNFCG